MGAHPRFTLRACHFEECDAAELARQRFDSVVLVNVLEHIADDVSALKAFDRIVVPGGRVIVFVPALQMAYIPRCRARHHRRYSKRTLRAALASAGLELIRLRYTNPIGLAGMDAQRARQQVPPAQSHAGEAVRDARRAVGIAASNGFCRLRSVCH